MSSVPRSGSAVKSYTGSSLEEMVSDKKDKK